MSAYCMYFMVGTMFLLWLYLRTKSISHSDSVFRASACALHAYLALISLTGRATVLPLLSLLGLALTSWLPLTKTRMHFEALILACM